MKNQDEYKLERIIKFPGMTAKIYRPILTEDEHRRRMKIIHKACADLLKAAENSKCRNHKSISDPHDPTK